MIYRINNVFNVRIIYQQDLENVVNKIIYGILKYLNVYMKPYLDWIVKPFPQQINIVSSVKMNFIIIKVYALI